MGVQKFCKRSQRSRSLFRGDFAGEPAEAAVFAKELPDERQGAQFGNDGGEEDLFFQQEVVLDVCLKLPEGAVGQGLEIWRGAPEFAADENAERQREVMLAGQRAEAGMAEHGGRRAWNFIFAFAAGKARRRMAAR